MVNEDQRLRGLAVALFTALLSCCGCVQTESSVMQSKAPIALAVAKPAGPVSSTGNGTENPVQLASAQQDTSATEQAPPPRPMPPGPQGVDAPQLDPQAKNAPPAATPNNGAPGQPNPNPALARAKPAQPPPGAPGLVPPGAFVDPHQRPVPTAIGGLLNLPPGESLAERALELSARLSAADANRQALEQRARELSAALEARDLALLQHGKEIHEAAAEVTHAREQVATWHKELEEARIRLRNREQEDVQTLKAIIALLDRLNTAGLDVRTTDREGTRVPEE